MCGIVGYIGARSAQDVVIAGLKRLEYRGYDSAGVAIVSDAGVEWRKKQGKIANLEAAIAEVPLPESHVGIGHTRWATHGAPTDANSHPHVAGRIAVVHNGIIENHAALRAEFEADAFHSETDSEVAAHLLNREVEQGATLTEAMHVVAKQLEGAFTLVAVDGREPGRLVAARRNSPLVLGRGEGEFFVASDVAAFIEFTKDAIELGQDQVVSLTADSMDVTDFDGKPAEFNEYRVEWDLAAAEKQGYDWFMRKEIFEQPQAVADTLLGRLNDRGELVLDELRISPEELRRVNKIIIIACGTAFYAGLVAKYAIEHWVRVACEVELASEFRYRDPIVDANTLVVAISQSGETADTLMAIRHAREQGSRVIAICNTNGATIPRESDAVIYTHAGPEIGVASTKGYTTQLVACYLLGLYLAQVRGMKYGDEVAALLAELERMPQMIQEVLDGKDRVHAEAERLKDVRSMLFLGRHVGYPTALEGALKLKELAYIHAEGFSAGELKHGPIALVSDGIPIFVVVPPKGRDQLRDKVIGNISEVRARGAMTIVLGEESDAEAQAHADVFWPLPHVSTLLQPLVSIIPLQLFACEMATQMGHDVDQPRNLAKSVTVE